MTNNLPNTPYFAHERLAAYRYARATSQFIAKRRHKLRGLPGKVGPQLERAVVGAHTNLCAAASAEGAERRRLFRLALSEAGEAGGCADLALDFAGLSVEEHMTLREMLLHLARCLHGLAHR